MPEEAQLLVEKGVAYIVDDVKAHEEGLSGLSEDERLKYQKGLEREGQEVARFAQAVKSEKSEAALKRMKKSKDESGGLVTKTNEGELTREEDDSEESLFAPETPNRPPSPVPSQALSITSTTNILRYAITPTTSYPPLPTPPLSPAMPLPEVPPSYPLFAHLHSHGYFISPGLRFGCQYLVYPGDPLRFHSHFLATGMQWDEEIDLLDLVGGGRLGTGVKKGYLIGGIEEDRENHDNGVFDNGNRTEEDRVRTFCIEWGGM